MLWRGLRAVYSLSEEKLMRGLPERELLVLHSLKALFGGEIYDPADPALELDRAVERPEPPQNDERPAPEVNATDNRWRTRRRGEPIAHGQTAIAD